MTATGAAMFARFAFPPNVLGYCGPRESQELFAYGSGLIAPDRGLEQLARSFEGAWPYLEALNDLSPVNDPLGKNVVEAYWIGNALLSAVDSHDWGNHLAARFSARAGPDADRLTAGVGRGAVPNHAFHVFGVYPWVGLLRSGRGGTEPLRIMDKCRIRWGTVIDITADQATVATRPLTWMNDVIGLGPPTLDTVVHRSEDGALADGIAPGDTVALHWDWLCQKLNPRQVMSLEQVTRSQLAVANEGAGVGTGAFG